MLKNYINIIVFGMITIFLSLLFIQYMMIFISFYIIFILIVVYNINVKYKNILALYKNDNEILNQDIIDVIQKIDSPVVYLNRDGIIMFYNQIFKRNFHLENLEKQKYDKVFENELLELIKQSFLLKKDFVHIIFILRKYYKVNVKIQFDNGTFTGVFVLFSDISQIKEVEKLQIQFFLDIYDELKQSLMKIKYLLNDLKKKEDVHELLLENYHIDHILNDVFRNINKNKEKIELFYVNFNIKDLIDECITSFEMLAKEKHLVFDYQNHIDDSLLLDYSSIKTIINHLIGNAIDYSNDGMIRIETLIENDCLEIKVQDEGIGIAEKDIPFIFESFYQIQNSHTSRIAKGLGLAVVKKMVDMNHGTIEVFSKQGIGSIFIVKIPINNTIIYQNMDIF